MVVNFRNNLRPTGAGAQSCIVPSTYVLGYSYAAPAELSQGEEFRWLTSFVQNSLNRRSENWVCWRAKLRLLIRTGGNLCPMKKSTIFSQTTNMQKAATAQQFFLF